MSKRCPYRHLPYSSWRLHALCRLVLRSIDPFNGAPRRNFLTTITRQSRSPPSDLRQLSHSESSKVEDNRILRQALSEISASIDQSLSPVGVPPLRPHEDSLESDKSDKVQNDPSESETTPSQGPSNPCPTLLVSGPSPSKSLVRSPLFIRTEKGPKQRKRKATKEDDDRLRRNPWAMALASPVRLCSATRTRLPGELLGDWGLVQHPSTHALWLLPTSLLRDELGKAKEQTRSSQERDRFPVLRIVARSSVIDALSRKFKKALISRYLLPQAWKSPNGPLSQAQEKGIIWREDMASYVLHYMRKDTVKALKKACLVGKKGKKAGVWNVLDIGQGGENGLREGLQKIAEVDQMAWGGVLVLRPTGVENKAQSEQNGENVSEGSSHSSVSQETELSPAHLPIPLPTISKALRPTQLPDFITLPNLGSQVPVFDLTELLSDHDLEELRQHHPLFQKDALFFRPGGDIPVDAMLTLWRFKGFLMYDRRFQYGK